jgi:hypothetical protein
MAMPPGLNGLLAQRQFAQQEQQGQLGQMQGLLSMQNAMTQQGQLQKETELKGLLGQRLQAGDQEGAKQILIQWKPELFAAELAPKAPERVDLGGSIGYIKDGKIVAQIPKSATPDAQLREDGENNRFAGVSGNTQFTCGITLRGQDLTDLRTRSEGAANRGVTMRGQDLGRNQFDSDRGGIVNLGTGMFTPVTYGVPSAGNAPSAGAPAGSPAGAPIGPKPAKIG